MIKTFSRFICASLLLLFVTPFVSCGTTHHFIPPTPLAEGDWRIQVVWHADFNSLHAPRTLLFPDIGAYYGLRDSTTLGFGSHFLPSLTHVSLIRYYSSSSRRMWNIYATLRLLSLSRNPYFEVGGTYSFIGNEIQQNIGLGFGYGVQPAWPLDWSGARAAGGIIPFAKYTLTGRDVGLSVAYYHGQVKRQVMASIQKALEHNDTIVNIEPGELESALINTDISSYSGDVTTIFYDDNKRIDFRIAGEYPDGFSPQTDRGFDDWLPSGFRLRWVGKTWVILDEEEIRNAVENKSRLIIKRIPERLLGEINKNIQTYNDLTVGIGVFSYPK